MVQNVDTAVTRATITDARGYFAIQGLPPGPYNVRATLRGFETTIARVTLAVAEEAGVNLILQVGGTRESITVTTRSPAVSAVVTGKTISQLPLNGRNFIDLALLQAGVASFNEKDNSAGASNRGTKLNINGMTFRSNSYLLDGANMRGYHGTVIGSLGLESIQEFRVVTNGYSADYGRAMGGVVSLVSRSGTNMLHGSGFEFFRDSGLDARDFFDRAKPPRFRRNQFGGSLLRPIRIRARTSRLSR